MNVYQRGRRGSKADVEVVGYGAPVDAWFWWYQAEPGSLVAVDVDVGWGSHTQRDGVHYIGSGGAGHGVLAEFPSKDLSRAERHLRRRAR